MLRQTIPLPPVRSDRARAVARWFDLKWTVPTVKHDSRFFQELVRLLPHAGQILLIVGPSGSGKSCLLREMRKIIRSNVIDLDMIDLPDRPLVDCFDELPLRATMRKLSRVGLAEAWTFLRAPGELSDGQRWRLRLALALNRAQTGSVLCVDEFCALLDRISACVVARMFRQSMDGRLRAIVATSQEDVIDPLQPDTIVRCDFGTIQIDRIN